MSQYYMLYVHGHRTTKPSPPKGGATICHIDTVYGSRVKVIHRFIFVLCETFNVRMRRDFLTVVKIIINKERINMNALANLLKKNKDKTELLIFILRTLDKEYNSEVQSTDNPIGLIRDKIDRLLNK